MTDPSSPRGTESRPAESAGLSQVFAELGKLLYSTDDTSLHEVLRRVAEAAQRVVPELDEVSVTLMVDRQAKTVVFTGPSAAYLDERQYEAGFGPCMDAATSGGTVTVVTADPDGVYPEFSRIAASRGITHVLSVGLPVPQRTVGALNMYSRRDQLIAPESVALAEAFAGYAGVAVANATLYYSAVDEARHMHEALRTRAVIEQAKGIVMNTRHCTSDQAFALLSRASQQQNRKLHDIATEIVASTRHS